MRRIRNVDDTALAAVASIATFEAGSAQGKGMAIDRHRRATVAAVTAASVSKDRGRAE
jgi:hypothetical protein